MWQIQYYDIQQQYQLSKCRGRVRSGEAKELEELFSLQPSKQRGRLISTNRNANRLAHSKNQLKYVWLNNEKKKHSEDPIQKTAKLLTMFINSANGKLHYWKSLKQQMQKQKKKRNRSLQQKAPSQQNLQKMKTTNEINKISLSKQIIQFHRHQSSWYSSNKSKQMKKRLRVQNCNRHIYISYHIHITNMLGKSNQMGILDIDPTNNARKFKRNHSV